MTLNIPQPVQKILDILQRRGKQAYVVGGCVRDSLLGKEPKDWDVTTSALPQETMEALADCTVIPTGLQHGTVTAVVDSMPVEITTYRVDGTYSDNRHPDRITFTASLREDLSRRDFTINAMAYHPQTGIADYFGGQTDLANRTVRCVGEPDKRFEEDALRILRALRFAAVLDFTIEKNTQKSILRKQELILRVAKERIAKEFVQLLCGSNAYGVLYDYAEVIGQFIPELLPLVGFEQHNPHHIYDVYEHTLHSVQAIQPIPVLRLTMLFHDVAKPLCFSRDAQGTGHFYGHAAQSAQVAQQVLTGLRLDKATIARVVTLVKLHDVQIENSEKSVVHWLNKLPSEVLYQLLAVKAADTIAQHPSLLYRLDELKELSKTMEHVVAQQKCFSLKDLALSGDDLIALGIPQGKEIGVILQRLLHAVMDGACENDRQKLLYFTRSITPQAIRAPEFPEG